MPDTPDEGTEQAVDDGGKTATAAQGDTGSAPGSDEVEALKKQFEEVNSEAEKLRERHANAERKIREQGAELGRYRQIVAGDGAGQDYGADTTNEQGTTAGDRALARASWSMLAEEIEGTPTEKRQLRERVEKFLNEDSRAGEFIRSDPYHTYRAVVEHWQSEKEKAELQELREWKAKANSQKETFASGAIVSGSGAREKPVEMTREEFRSLPRDKQREILKKIGVMRP